MSLIIREKQMKITMNYYPMPFRVASITKQKTSVGEYVEKLEPLHTFDGNAKWCRCFGKQNGVSSKYSQ